MKRQSKILQYVVDKSYSLPLKNFQVSGDNFPMLDVKGYQADISRNEDELLNEDSARRAIIYHFIYWDSENVISTPEKKIVL